MPYRFYIDAQAKICSIHVTTRYNVAPRVFDEELCILASPDNYKQIISQLKLVPYLFSKAYQTHIQLRTNTNILEEKTNVKKYKDLI